MKQIKITGFIPFGVIDANGDMVSKDCKVTLPSAQCGYRIIDSHENENGITIITKVELLEASYTNEPL